MSNNMDFIKHFAGGRDLGHLGKKLTKGEMLGEEMQMLMKQMQILQLNIQNMRQILLAIGRLSGINPAVLVRALQEVEKSEQYVKDLTIEEEVIKKENESKKATGDTPDDASGDPEDKVQGAVPV